MKNFMNTYGLYIIVVLAGIAVRLFVAYKSEGKKGLLKEAESTILSLMLGEEKNVSKVGQDKMNSVVSSLFKVLPNEVKTVLDENKLQDYAQEVYNKAKTTAEKLVPNSVIPDVVKEVGQVVDSVVKDSISNTETK